MSDLVASLRKAADRLGYDVQNGADPLGLKLHDVNTLDEAAAELGRLSALVEDARAILSRIDPHLDSIVCYASTMGEHEPNRIAFDARATLAKLGGE